MAVVFHKMLFNFNLIQKIDFLVFKNNKIMSQIHFKFPDINHIHIYNNNNNNNFLFNLNYHKEILMPIFYHKMIQVLELDFKHYLHSIKDNQAKLFHIMII